MYFNIKTREVVCILYLRHPRAWFLLLAIKTERTLWLIVFKQHFPALSLPLLICGFYNSQSPCWVKSTIRNLVTLMRKHGCVKFERFIKIIGSGSFESQSNVFSDFLGKFTSKKKRKQWWKLSWLRLHAGRMILVEVEQRREIGERRVKDREGTREE